MYFWNIKQLKYDLSLGPLAETESFKYLMAYIICLGLPPLFGSPAIKDSWRVLFSVTGLVILIGGTLYCYHKNGGAQGKHFVQHYLAIGWVVGFRLGFLVVLPLMFIIFGLAAAKVVTAHSIWPRVAFQIVGVCLYWRLGEHMHEVASAQKTA